MCEVCLEVIPWGHRWPPIPISALSVILCATVPQRVSVAGAPTCLQLGQQEVRTGGARGLWWPSVTAVVRARSLSSDCYVNKWQSDDERQSLTAIDSHWRPTRLSANYVTAVRLESRLLSTLHLKERWALAVRVRLSAKLTAKEHIRQETDVTEWSSNRWRTDRLGANGCRQSSDATNWAMAALWEPLAEGWPHCLAVFARLNAIPLMTPFLFESNHVLRH